MHIHLLAVHMFFFFTFLSLFLHGCVSIEKGRVIGKHTRTHTHTSLSCQFHRQLSVFFFSVAHCQHRNFFLRFFFVSFAYFLVVFFFFFFSLCVVVNRAPVSWGLCDGVYMYFSLAFLFWLYSLFFLFLTPSLVFFFFLPLFRFSCA